MFSNAPALPAPDEILQGKNHSAPLPPPFSLPFLAPLAVFTESKAFHCIPLQYVQINTSVKKKNNFGEPGPLPACLDSRAVHGAGRVFFKRREAEENSLRILAQAGHISA